MALILVVDDSVDDLILLSTFLQNAGHTCRLANSGVMALDLISAETFDLILTDFEMDDGDGLWLLKEIKKAETSPHLILLTSNSNYSAAFFKSHGAAAVCSKPINWEKLDLEICRLL